MDPITPAPTGSPLSVVIIPDLIREPPIGYCALCTPSRDAKLTPPLPPSPAPRAV